MRLDDATHIQSLDMGWRRRVDNDSLIVKDPESHFKLVKDDCYFLTWIFGTSRVTKIWLNKPFLLSTQQRYKFGLVSVISLLFNASYETPVLVFPSDACFSSHNILPASESSGGENECMILKDVSGHFNFVLYIV